jgi:hypothetical protein
MQVFIIGSPFETAKILDKRRLNKQIIEVNQILNAIKGSKAWHNHPCTIQYKGHVDWLENYLSCLIYYKNGLELHAEVESDLADVCRPSFHTEEYFNQMKRRLYTKNKIHYSQYSYLGESNQNWYFVNNEWKIYTNGKLIKNGQ